VSAYDWTLFLHLVGALLLAGGMGVAAAASWSARRQKRPSEIAVVLGVAGKLGGTYAAGRVGGFTPRQSLNAGTALVARGEFTVILAQVAATNPALSAAARRDLVAFAGLYVLATAVIGVLLMKESKRIGRRLFPPPPKLAPEGGAHGSRAP